VPLLESFEDDILLVGRDAYPGIGYGEGDHLIGGGQADSHGAPAVLGDGDLELYAALGGELEGVRQQVVDDLLEAKRVRVHGVGQARGESGDELHSLLGRDLRECATHLHFEVAESQIVQI